MKLGDLSPRDLRDLLAGNTLVLRTGPFATRIHSPMPGIADGLLRLYPDFPLDDGDFCDFHVRVGPPTGIRRWLKPQINFWHDGHSPFKPLPANHAFALLEWGLNWCVAGHAHHYLMLHAAVLEKNGRAVVLPGDPGAGKSTLTAALMLSGWRLLSDEITLIDRDDGLIVGLARPVSLKNASIDVIRHAFPDAIIGAPAHDTHKGTVAHLRATPDSIARVGDKARAAWVIFPRWREGAEARLSPHSRADAFLHTANHAFNYSLLGSLGFELNAALMDACECHDFEYSRLDDAMRVFAELAAS
ncbi:MAG: HprK-related kinase A [Hydrogenophilales bacterium]|jgi:HprK-related kinase A|nr:HprK-related kinase A [Hydrogenophilales bacterium]